MTCYGLAFLTGMKRENIKKRGFQLNILNKLRIHKIYLLASDSLCIPVSTNCLSKQRDLKSQFLGHYDY
jgi:hypothetical protein